MCYSCLEHYHFYKNGLKIKAIITKYDCGIISYFKYEYEYYEYNKPKVKVLIKKADSKPYFNINYNYYDIYTMNNVKLKCFVDKDDSFYNKINSNKEYKIEFIQLH